MPSEIEKRAANLAALPLAVALLVIAIPFFEINGSEAVFTFAYWGGGDTFNRMEVIRNFALIVGGFLGLWLAWRRIALMDKQTTISQSDHLALRYENAIGLLESESETTRISGIHAIADLATKNPETHLEAGARLLCAVLRQKRKAVLERQKATPEFEEIIQVLGRFKRLSQEDASLVPGIEFDLRGVCFDELTLDGWNFDNVKMKGAVFRSSRLNECSLGFNFGDVTSFVGTHFSETRLAASFEEVDFTQCIFESCNVQDAAFVDCNLSGAAFHSTVVNGEMVGVGLASCRLDNMKISPTMLEALSLILNGHKVIPSNFQARNFTDCWISEHRVMPKKSTNNEPVLEAQHDMEREEGGYYIEFREVEASEDDA